MEKKERFAQVSMEYLLIVGFVTFAILSILGIAFFYSGSIRDRIKETQIENFANKVISTSESVFYAGRPSKATITAYLPDNVQNIIIGENDLIIEFQTHSGLNKRAFTSNVPVNGTITTSQGLKKLQIEAQETFVNISMGG